MRVKLKQAFDLQMGKTPARNVADYWNGCYSWVSIADLGNISNKYIVSTREKITDRGIADSKIKIVPKETVIMSFKLSIGKTAITSEDMYTNEAIIAFHNRGIYNIDTEYLYYFCCGTDWGIGTNKAVMGLTLNKKTLSEREIEIPDIALQRKVVARLNKIDAIINRRRQQLQELDRLVKSRFVELFGKCENMVAINDLCSIITDGTHQPPKFKDKGIPFIFVSNLANNTVTYNAEKFISDETYNELIKRTPIEIGDVLLSTVGSYGHPAVVTENRKFLFQRHIAYMKPRHEMINSFYLHSALLAPDGQRQIEERVKGIAQKTLNLSEIRKIMIPIPSIEEQNQFEKFIRKVDKSKYCSQKFAALCSELIKIYEQEWMSCQTLRF